MSVDTIVRDENLEMKSVIRSDGFSYLVHFEETTAQAKAGREILYLLRELPSMGFPDPARRSFRNWLAGKLLDPRATVNIATVKMTTKEIMAATAIFEQQCRAAEAKGHFFAERLLQQWVASLLIGRIAAGEV